MIGNILLLINKRFYTPGNNLLGGIVLNSNSKNLFLSRLYVWESIFSCRLNIKSNKLDLTDVEFDFVFRIFLRNILVDISVVSVNFKSIYFVVFFIKLSTIPNAARIYFFY